MSWLIPYGRRLARLQKLRNSIFSWVERWATIYWLTHSSDSRLHRNHLDFAKSRDGEHRVVAGLDRHGRNDTAGDHHHAGFEAAAALGEVIGEPGQRRARVLGAAFARRLAADLEPAGDADQRRDGCGFGRADDDAAVPAVLDDQRGGFGLGVIGVAVFDQLE